MNKILPIKVEMPMRWRLAGCLFILVSAVSLFTIVCLLLIPDHPMARENWEMVFFGLVCLLPTSVFLLPCFIGHYPRWVVFIFGQPYLQQLVDQCRTNLSGLRVEKARLTSPMSWFNDQRVVWIAILGGLFLFGLLKTL